MAWKYLNILSQQPAEYTPSVVTDIYPYFVQQQHSE